MVNAVSNPVVPKFTVIVGNLMAQEIMRCVEKHTIQDYVRPSRISSWEVLAAKVLAQASSLKAKEN
jgi:hypothetical protein